MSEPKKEHLNEIWKDIPDYDGLYQVSNLGRCISFNTSTNWGKKYRETGRILVPLKRSKFGYLSYNLTIKNKIKSFDIHRLVANAFVKKITGKPDVNHLNGDKSDNRAINLEWVNRRENCIHYLRNKKLIGSSFNSTSKKYQSTIIIKGVSVYLGSYHSPYEAHLAYLFASHLYNVGCKYL